MKDNFSSKSDAYAQYRPGYPAAFLEYLNSIVPNKQNAWDCGTGNGQLAFELSRTFDTVYATDISQAQMDQAAQSPNIHYSLQAAEQTNFHNGQFDLITVAQAIHWFDFERFYTEVRRTAKKGALLCAVGYARIEIDAAIDAIITHFYEDIIGPYWDPERRYIDAHYQSIPFPFEAIATPVFQNKYSWTLAHLTGYLRTWSAVKHFIAQNGYDPVDQLEAALASHWAVGTTKDVVFPLLLRIGKVR